MKHLSTGRRREFFKVLASTRTGQAAMMTLRPGQDTGEPQSEHPDSEQWLFVISGTGRARVGRRTVNVKEGSLLLVEMGEVHQVKNAGRRPLVTINFYAPPAYTSAGDTRIAGPRGALRAVLPGR